ncbi:aldo/keto reductase [Kribbella pittospori]|uniref:aldo/keto reductase n=1 Tax=Kribbella pittospori TaxID=722689 RepID=UPI001EDCE554|nr:aldo/keto reductase [Kribbella pittospori]
MSNLFSYSDQSDTATLDFCTERGIPYLAFGPIGYAANDTPPARTGLTAAQTRLAWLLDRSPVTVAIPGSSNIDHLEANIAAAARSS